jgi:hypothetical protein
MDLEGSIGRDLQNGLNNLKGILEQTPTLNPAEEEANAPGNNRES